MTSRQEFEEERTDYYGVLSPQGHKDLTSQIMTMILNESEADRQKKTTVAKIQISNDNWRENTGK